MLVDLKSTIFYQRITFLLINIFFNHLVGYISRGHSEIASRLKMPSPELFSNHREFLHKYVRTYPFELLYYLAYTLCRAIRYKHMNMVRGNLAGDNLKVILRSYLPQQFSGTFCDISNQYFLPIFRYPYQVYLKVCFCMGTYSVMSHSDKILSSFA